MCNSLIILTTCMYGHRLAVAAAHLNLYLKLSEHCGHRQKHSVYIEWPQLPGLVRHVNMSVLNQGHGAKCLQVERDNSLLWSVIHVGNAIASPPLAFVINEESDIGFIFSYKN